MKTLPTLSFFNKKGHCSIGEGHNIKTFWLKCSLNLEIIQLNYFLVSVLFYFANVVDFSSSIKSDKAGMVIVSL